MSCKHGNWPPCDQCDELDERYNDGYKAGIKEMQLPAAEHFEVFVPRNNGHVLVKLTLLNDRPTLDFIHTAFLNLVVEMLTEANVLPDGAERCVTVTDILTFAAQKYV